MKPFYESRPGETIFVGSICNVPYPAHVHDVVEIVCLRRGRVNMMIGSISYSLVPGDIAMVFPSVTHAYESVSPDAEGLALIFHADTVHEYMSTLRTVRPTDPVMRKKLRDPAVAEAVRELTKLSSDLSKPLVRAYLHVFLAATLPDLALFPLSSMVEEGMAGQVIHYISEHFREPITQSSVSHELGISYSHLSHLFSGQLNINFRRYINSLRVGLARQMLSDPSISVLEVSYGCGYENTRTFRRAFYTETGMTPSEYRASLGLKVSLPENEADGEK